jgi:hypothetical protein
MAFTSSTMSKSAKFLGQHARADLLPNKSMMVVRNQAKAGSW